MVVTIHIDMFKLFKGDGQKGETLGGVFYGCPLTNQVYSKQIVNNHDIGIVGTPYRKVDTVIDIGYRFFLKFQHQKSS